MNLKNLRLICFFAIVGLLSISLQARSGYNTNPNFSLTDTIWPPTDTLVIFEPVTISEKLYALQPRIEKFHTSRIALDSATARYCDSLVDFYKTNTELYGPTVLKELVGLRSPIAYERVLNNFCIYRRHHNPRKLTAILNNFDQDDYPIEKAVYRENENYRKNLIYHFFQNWRNYEIADEFCLGLYCGLFRRDKPYYEYCVREFPPHNEQERSIYAKIDKIVKKTY